LGRAAAARLLERGASVAIHVRDRARAEATARELGGASVAMPGDLEQEGVAVSVVERTVAAFGRRYRSPRASRRSRLTNGAAPSRST
jgi:NAD(P)-dependent dehydrogenase (short-subunit alcohol dehydrogenase family)